MPFEDIPREGLSLTVQDDDGNGEGDEELIGSFRTTRYQVEEALRGQPLIVLKDNEDGGAVERLEVLIRPVRISAHRSVVTMQASAGTVVMPNFHVIAGEILEVHGVGNYTLNRTAFLANSTTQSDPRGTAGTFGNLPGARFGNQHHGAAVAMIGMHRQLQQGFVPLCARFIAQYSGNLVVGINDDTPGDNAGQLSFSVFGRAPTPEEWRIPGATGPCIAHAQRPSPEVARQLDEQMKGDPNLKRAMDGFQRLLDDAERRDRPQQR